MRYFSRGLNCFRILVLPVFVAGILAAALPATAAWAEDSRNRTAASVDPKIWDIARGGQLYDNWFAALVFVGFLVG